MKLWTAAHASAADRHTIDVVGIPSAVLMERAALSVAHEVVVCSPPRTPVRTLVGPGNNGADALAVGRILHGWGVDTTAVLVTAKRNDAGVQQLALARSCGLRIEDDLGAAAIGRAVWVDGLLGTGARGAPHGVVLAALERLSACEGVKVAIDLPSGVDPDTGGVVSVAFRANVTVTFARSKPGLHITPGSEHAGRVVVADIGIVSPSEDALAVGLVDTRWCGDQLRTLPAPMHKGTRGHVTVVGGGEHTPGAAILAATAALRSTAGLCTVATASAATRDLLARTRPELMLNPWPSSALPGDALVVGPGLTGTPGPSTLAALFRDDPRPAVWDASGLGAIPPAVLPSGPRVLTPHPKEAAALYCRAEGVPSFGTKDVQAARLGTARRLAAAYNAVVVLKGAGSVVATPQGAAWVSGAGTAALATAGTGDVLAGLCGALLAAGIGPAEAARLAAHLHGLAGRTAEHRAAPARSVVALDVVEALRTAIDRCLDGTADTCLPELRRC